MAYKLLLVDDEIDAIEALRHSLVKAGYEAVTAYDGKDALVKLEEHNPDIILLDIIMPGMNGFEVLNVIREKYKDKWRPVIVVSAKNELESLEKCYEMEADHYLTKPCSVEQILQGIRTMISLMPARIK